MEIMKIFTSFLFAISFVLADDQSPTLAERLVSTLPELPSVIRSGFNGETGGFQKMISNVLGDGLISQLVNDPLQVAGHVLPDLNNNSTDLKSQNDFSKSLLRLLTTTVKPTTQETMLVDGQEVDFDNFVRTHRLEKLFSTSKPIPPSPTPPSADKIADEVLNKIRKQMGDKKEVTRQTEESIPSSRFILPPLSPDTSSMYNMDYMRKFIESQGNVFGGSPPGVQQTSTFPNLGIMDNSSPGSYEEIRKLKDMLNAYEEVVQTKDFFSKRKQLQNLESQLKLHRDRISEQQQLENTLRQKEKELQLRKKEMEEQIHAQLKSWNLTEISEATTKKSEISIAEPSTTTFDTISERKPVHLSTVPVQDKIFQNFNDEIILIEEKDVDANKPAARAQYVLENADGNMMPDESFAFEMKPAEPIIQTTCDCKKLSLNMLKGYWTIAFATSNLLNRVLRMMTSITETNSDKLELCSSLRISSNESHNWKKSNVVWRVSTKSSKRVWQVNGNIKREEDRTMSIEGTDFIDIFGERLCALKSSNVGSEYDYVLFSIVKESCREVMLLVRNPQRFFNEENEDLTKYLKNKIDNREIEEMQLSPITC